MNATIESPTLADIATLYRWGQENQELWISEHARWFDRKQLIDLITNPGEHVMLVARVDLELAGVCVAYNLRGWGFISDIFVLGKYRKQGIGKKLFNKMVGKFKNHGVAFFALTVRVENKVAQEFYKKLGFSKGDHYQWMYKRDE